LADWHSKDVDEVFHELYSGPTGLTDKNAQTKILKFGRNELKDKDKKPPWKLFLEQFNNFIIWILMIAAILSFISGDIFEGILITAILILNAGVGFWQEYKAEESIEALRKLTALQAKVIRQGQERRIDARELVPGDIIILETGDKVPADARLVDAARLCVDESTLTGESTPIKKSVDKVKANAPLAERLCTLHSSSVVSAGRAKAIVVETGMNTEIGKIADLVSKAEAKQTPLQHKLSEVGKFLGVATLIICAVVFIVQMLSGIGMHDSFELAISLAVAAIPEGLAAVVTVCLALGVQRMVKKNALVRVLPAVETLGSCNVICTDKTGTLTYNQMTVRKIFTNNQDIEVTGQGYVPEGVFESKGKKFDPAKIRQLLKVGALCNDAKLKKRDDWEIFGDPTEAALIVAARKAGLDSETLNKAVPRVDELPFDSARKLMTTMHREKTKLYAFTKGAPDIIVHKCNKIYINGKVRKMTAKDRETISKKNLDMANTALRVLGFAYKQLSKKNEKNIESGLVFIGLMGMIDPPRKEVIEAIKKCKDAGIKVVMITGDHKATAVAIGKELGMPTESVMTGEDIDKNHSLSHIIEKVTVYARVSPQHKMLIINAFKHKKYVVAMTGDGVNDAPALKRADIGIAMGKAGTDVAKEASDMILTDDNFASIVNAVEEGRGIYDNIRKFVKYLLSSNLGEVLTIFFAVLIAAWFMEGNVILPLTAIQLLWINILTDSFPALALGLEPTEKDVMKRQPRKQSDKIIDRNYILDMIFVGTIMTAGTLFVFFTSLPLGSRYAITMSFSTLVVFQLFNVVNCKSEKSIFKVGIMNNPWLIKAIILSLALQFLVVYAPYLYDVLSSTFNLPAFDLGEQLGTVALDLKSWLVIFVIGSTVLIFEEIKKFIQNGRT